MFLFFVKFMNPNKLKLLHYLDNNITSNAYKELFFTINNNNNIVIFKKMLKKMCSKILLFFLYK